MALVPLSDEDGSWGRLKDAWRAQCEHYGEDFDNYAVGTFSVLNSLAAEGHPRAAIFGVEENGQIIAICQPNRALIPGYPSHVLRVRLLTVCPHYDFSDIGVEEYATLLVELFNGVLELSNGEMEAKYLKFHLRSPADVQFFAALRVPLAQVPVFAEVDVKGMWLHVTKS
jgi:hypothetical protein